jgi:hypothetical protein
MRRWLTWPARRPGWTVLLLAALFAAAYAASLVLLRKPDGRIVVGDAVHYYVYVRSLVFDRDLHFQNEYQRLYRVDSPGPETDWIFTPLPSGYIRNMMPIGPALVSLPLYLLTGLGAWILSGLGIGGPIDGFGRAFQASAGFSGIAAASLGAWIAFQTARRVFDPFVAVWATLVVWLGSSALYYSLVSPTYSHASSMLATSLVVYVWHRTAATQTWRRYALLGGAVGLAALVRWQDAVFFILPAADVLRHVWASDGATRVRWSRALAWLGASGAAAVLVFVPQLLAWQTIYGQPLLVPQGSGFMQWTSPHLLEVLFSDLHGLFSWTPVIAFAVAGLCLFGTHDRRTGVPLVAVLLVSWYANAAVADWWAGEAFGARRFVSCFPLFVLGLGAVIGRWRGRTEAAALAGGVLVLANLLLLLQYQVFLKGWRDLAPYPAGFWDLWIARFVVPLRIVERLFGS